MEKLPHRLLPQRPKNLNIIPIPMGKLPQRTKNIIFTTKAEKRQYKIQSNGKNPTKTPTTKTEKRQYKTYSNGKTDTKAEKYHSCHKGYCHKGRKASTCHKSITQ